MMERPTDPQRHEPTYGGLTAGQLNGAFLAVLGIAVAGVCAWLFLFDGINTVTGKKETDQSAFLAQQAANRSILTLADLPEGWKARLADNEEDDIEFQFSDRCKVLEQTSFSSGIAAAESDDLYGPTQQKVNSGASVFAADATATQEFDAFNATWASCREEMLNVFKQVINESLAADGLDPAAAQVNASFDQVPAPNVGEATATMYRLSAGFQLPDKQASFTIDFMAIRHGRILSSLVYTAFNSTPSPEDEQQIAGLAAAKLVAASAALAGA